MSFAVHEINYDRLLAGPRKLGPFSRATRADTFRKKETREIRTLNGTISVVVRDFTYIDDIVEGVVRLIDQSAASAPTWSGSAPGPTTCYAPWRILNIEISEPLKLMQFIDLPEQGLGREAMIDS